MVRIPWNKGKTGVYSEEQLVNISAGTKNAMKDPEIRKKISNSKKGNIAWNKNVSCPEFVKLKISNTLTGSKHASETKLKMSNSHKGKKFSNETRKKLSLSQSFEKGNRWKGDEVGYNALHVWVSKKLGKPSVCEYCETDIAKMYDWANISHTYKRDVKDWARLCRSCHIAYDKNKITLKEKIHGR